MGLKRALTEFDLTNIIVGSIVGADIYIASALTVGLVGPFAIVVWIFAGICLFLLVSTPLINMIVGATVIAAGIPIHLYFSPKTDIHHLKEEFLSEEALFLRRVAKKERYLANFIGLLREAWDAGRQVVRRL